MPRYLAAAASLDRIKAAAEAQGFGAVIERPADATNESIDIVLLRQDRTHACEVSVSTTVDHEIGNARKCLGSGFQNVFLITAEERRRNQVAQAVTDHFSPKDRIKIRCCSPDESLTYLTSVPNAKSSPSEPEPKTFQGCKVTRKFSKFTPKERSAKTKTAFELLGQKMKLPEQHCES